MGTHCRGSREQKMACEPFGRDSPRGAAQTCIGCHVAVVWPLELKNARLEAPACHQSNARKRDPPGTKFGSCGPKSGAFPGRPRTKPAPGPRSLARIATGDAHGPSVVAPHPPGPLGTADKPPGISRETHPCRVPGSTRATGPLNSCCTSASFSTGIQAFLAIVLAICGHFKPRLGFGASGNDAARRVHRKKGSYAHGKTRLGIPRLSGRGRLRTSVVLRAARGWRRESTPLGVCCELG